MELANFRVEKNCQISQEKLGSRVVEVEINHVHSVHVHVLNVRSTFKVHTPVFCGQYLYKARADPFLWALMFRTRHPSKGVDLMFE